MDPDLAYGEGESVLKALKRLGGEIEGPDGRCAWEY